MLSDIEIAQRATLRPIIELARDRLRIPESELESYGRYKAKLSLAPSPVWPIGPTEN